MTTNKILIVDDESTVLDLYQLALSDEFEIDTADSGEAALTRLGEQGPCAIVVADMHMPGMNGTELLRRVEALHSETVRMMLTSDEQQTVAVEAVNAGQIFRFLNKPCPPDRLAAALRDGLTQYRLLKAERELLANTLSGSVSMLVEILSVANPLAFGRAARMRRLVQELCNRLELENSWEIPIAAMLSQVGCISVPDAVLAKVQRGERLTTEESKLYAAHPRLGHDLVSKIPRLQRIGDIIALQQMAYDSVPPGGENPGAHDLATRAAFLRATFDYDTLVEQGLPGDQAVRVMLIRPSDYEPRVLQALAQIANEERDRRACELSLSQLREGMILEEDLVDTAGAILITKGHEITEWLLERLRYQKTAGRSIREPIRVWQGKFVSTAPGASAPHQAPSLSVTV